MDANQDTCLGRQSAIAEARALYRMVGEEHTVEELRELIAVPPKIQAVLLAYAREFPEEAYFVGRTLKFRASVLQEFERLVRDGLPVDLPEAEEIESEPFVEIAAFAQA